MSELVVRREETERGLTVAYTYELRSSSEMNSGLLEQEHPVETAPQLIQDLCAEIDRLVESARTDAGQLTELTQTCQFLYNTLFPRMDGNIPDLAQRIFREDSLIIRTNESLIPWELLHDGHEFLALAHDLGRRTFVSRRIAVGRTTGKIDHALIVGDPLEDLGAARREAERVAAWLAGRGVTCELLLGRQATLMRVVRELDNRKYDLFHYSGHVATPIDTTHVGLRLHEDKLLDERALQSLSGAGVPPIVFVNGCASADPLSNLCVSFMTKGAKVVIGTRYEVREESARQFAEHFYADLTAGSPAGTAVKKARLALRENSDVEWASFVLYGDPSVVITPHGLPTRSGETSGDQQRGHPEIDARLDRPATEMMARAFRRAAPHGIVISLDLLTELLSTTEFRRRLTKMVSEDRIAEMIDVLSTLQEEVPATATETDGRVKLSGTVESVLARAERRAQRAGRDRITIDDIAAEFIAIGGGSSRNILELFGVSLNEVPAGEPANGSRPHPVPDPAVSTAEPPSRPARGKDTAALFDADGMLRTERLTSSAVVALRVATLLAAAQGTVVSTNMLLLAFAVVENEALRDALVEQGQNGAAVLQRISSSVKMRRPQFSSRTRRALARAAGEKSREIDDAAVLRELLAEENSTARTLLARLGIDPDRISRALSRRSNGHDDA